MPADDASRSPDAEIGQLSAAPNFILNPTRLRQSLEHAADRRRPHLQPRGNINRRNHLLGAAQGMDRLEIVLHRGRDVFAHEVPLAIHQDDHSPHYRNAHVSHIAKPNAIRSPVCVLIHHRL